MTAVYFAAVLGGVLLAAVAALAGAWGRRKIRRLIKYFFAANEKFEQYHRSSIGIQDYLYQKSRPIFVPEPMPRSLFVEGRKWREIALDAQGARPWRPHSVVRAIAYHQGVLYVGLGGMRPEGARAEVWARENNEWRRIGSWEDTDLVRVQSIVLHREYLYVALLSTAESGKAQVWRLRDQTWEKIGGGGINDGWKDDFDVGQRLIVFRDELYVAVVGKRGSVYRWRDEKWHKVAGDYEYGSWGADYDYAIYTGVYEFLATDDYLYVSTAKTDHQGAFLWRFDGRAWEIIGGNGIRGSWYSPLSYAVLGLTIFQDHVVASVDRPEGTFGGATSFWAFDGQEWKTLSMDRLPGPFAIGNLQQSFAVYNGRLYVGYGGKPRNLASVWELQDDASWRPVAGAGLFDSWASKPIVGTSSGISSAYEAIYRLHAETGSLFAGFVGFPGTATIWEFNGEERVEMGGEK